MAIQIITQERSHNSGISSSRLVPKDQNPVSQHDTIGDVEPDFNEYVLIKFKLDRYTIPGSNSTA